MIGIASTCLSETIGEDVEKILREFRAAHAVGTLPELVAVSTPSYKGSHMDGFHATVLALTKQFARRSRHQETLSIFPGLVSPEDIRYLKQVMRDFGVSAVIMPDYSETLDGPAWEEYRLLPAGGTPLAALREMGSHAAALEFASTLAPEQSAAVYLETQFEVPHVRLDLPVGLRASDRFFESVSMITGKPVPEIHQEARGRLLDAYADAHKHVFGVPVAIYGEEDWVIALAGLAAEIGMLPVVCASGGRSGHLRSRLLERLPKSAAQTAKILDGVDFMEIEDAVREARPELLIGNSKGYALTRRLEIPLLRVGFPVHDRIGGARLLHVGYQGTQRLFDQWVNALLERRQGQSLVGYSYM
jgi:nitrogenase molybdenum-iron protein NifN